MYLYPSKIVFSIYNIFVSLPERAGEDKLLAKVVMEYFPNPYFVINWKSKMTKLVKKVGRAQNRAYGTQTEVIWDKEEFKEEIAKVGIWGCFPVGLWWEQHLWGPRRTKWCPFYVSESLSFLVRLELTILELLMMRSLRFDNWILG